MLWFEELDQIENRASQKMGKFKPGKDTDDACQARALELYDKACTAFKAKQSSKRDANINVLQGLLKKGTIEDQISALAVSVQESPVHLGEFCISKLLAIARKKSRNHAWISLEALRDIYTGCLLPDDRKLRPWDTETWNEIHPRLAADERNQWMIYRHFEYRIKSLYADVVTILESASTDPVEWFRVKTLSLTQELLSLKPEAEVRLLALLVNKVGDPTRKVILLPHFTSQFTLCLNQVSSQALKLIRGLFDAHTNMKGVIVDEIQRFLMRANITPRARYQAVILLTQIIFGPDDGPLARRLVDLYLSLFSRKDLEAESDSRLLSALLTGLNRAFPFAASLMNDEQYDTQTTRLLRLARSPNFNAAVQALMLLQQVMSARQSLCTRYYTALYDSLLSPSLLNSSKHSLYLNLLYRTIKNDVSVPRIAAFIKRLLQVCLQSRPGFICGSLILLAELCKHHPAIRCMIDQAVHQEDDIKYDALKRDPQYANANATCFWELRFLEHHYHPSVVRFTFQILNNEPIEYNGNPIADFTLRHFLDRFVYRNPKKTEATRSALAPRPSSLEKLVPVNTEEFWKLDESQIREDERFMHKFFRNRLERGEISEKPAKEAEESDEDDKDAFADKLFEDQLRKTDGVVDVDDDDDELGDAELLSDAELDQAFGDDNDQCIDDDNDEGIYGSEDEDDAGVDRNNMLNDDDDDVVFDDDDIIDNDVIEEESNDAKKTKKLAFADADDYAELLELTNIAAKAGCKTEAWQASGSKKRKLQPSRSKTNGKQFKKQKKPKFSAKSRK